MQIDIFRSDAFGLTQLTEAINLIPYAPTRLGQLGWFKTGGVSTTSVAVEMKQGVLTLVPAADRGAPGAVKTSPRGVIRQFKAVHLPQRVSVMADEVQNIRAFGTETETQLAMAKLNEKFEVARLDLDVTLEYQRIGAMKGVILDADGSTELLNLFTEFGVSQIAVDMNLDADATSVLTVCLGIKRSIEAELGALMYSNIRVMCSSGFFDAFVKHPAVVESYRRYQESIVLRSDVRAGFQFADMTWEEYRGSVNGSDFIGTDTAYAVPEGVPDLFVTKFAPANYMETVNTNGLPIYAKREMLPFDKGVDVEVQSNPIMYSTRPRAIVKLTKT